MKIVTVVPTYRRKDITIAVVKNLLRQTVPLEVIVVGSEAGDSDAARETRVRYVECANQPLSMKIQAGVASARELSPDAVMLCGSDDWLSTNWIETLAPYLENHEIVGGGIVYFLRVLPSDALQLIRVNIYKGTLRYGEPIGAGRLISKRILDRLDWRIWRERINSGCDGSSFKLMRANNARIFMYEEDKAKLLCPKGEWKQLSSWSSCANSKFVQRVDNPNVWMETHFEGVLDRLSIIRGR